MPLQTAFIFAEEACITAEEGITEGRATIARVAAERLAAGDDPPNADDDEE